MPVLVWVEDVTVWIAMLCTGLVEAGPSRA